MFRQIRTRLTAWYSGLLLLMLLSFGVIMNVAVPGAIERGIDRELQAQLNAVEDFMERQIPGRPRDRLPHEFAEHAELRPGGQMMQVSDSTGQWIFRSDSMRSLHLRAPGPEGQFGLTTETFQGVPIRVRAAVLDIENQRYYIQLGTSLDAAYGTLAAVRWLVLVLIPLMVLGASGGGYWLSNRALAPVDKIIDDAHAISFKNLSGRLQVTPTGDELQRLAETLNEMMGRLERSFRQITRFTADASHELRSPVALIRTTAEVALLQHRDVAAYRKALTDVLDEAERTTKLIEDLLALADTDGGTTHLAKSVVDARTPLAEACHQAKPGAIAKGIHFCTILPNSEVEVLGNAGAMRRLFLILMDNAIKYTAAGGQIGVSLETASGDSTVMVSDTGIGIEAGDLSNIFERFFRADKARQRDTGGFGLGLAIAKQIVEEHGAEICVESALNAGSRFIIRFPSV